MQTIPSISKKAAVHCVDTITTEQRRVPNPIIVSNLSLLWKFLAMTLQDWERESRPYQDKIDNCTPLEKDVYAGLAFIELQPIYLKCLFSYIMFFVSVEKAYESLYKEINSLNKESCFQVTPIPKPIITPYIKKVQLIRNKSIAHFGEERKGISKIDVIATAAWQPMTLGYPIDGPIDINNMTFGESIWNLRDKTGNLLEQSSDIKIAGIPELHQNCMQYIEEYDQVCSDYLDHILQKLPTTSNQIEYKTYK